MGKKGKKLKTSIMCEAINLNPWPSSTCVRRDGHKGKHKDAVGNKWAKAKCGEQHPVVTSVYCVKKRDHKGRQHRDIEGATWESPLPAVMEDAERPVEPFVP